MAWTKAPLSVSSIPEGGVVGAHVDGVPLAFYKLDGEILATHGICTHALALLCDGWVEDGKIECPLHQGQFDIRSGKALCEPLIENLKIYSVRPENDDIYVDLQSVSVDKQLLGEGSSAATSRPVKAYQKVVIVGGGQAGAVAARALRSAAFAGSVTIVSEEAHDPYERPSLSKDLLLKNDAQPVSRMTADDAAKLNIDILRGVSAVSVDSANRSVLLKNGKALPYDALLLAVGGQPRMLPISGGDLPGVFYLRTIEQARAIEEALGKARHVAVIGGGFVGLEIASSARLRGLAVTLLEREDELMSRIMPRAAGAFFRSIAGKKGVNVRVSTGVSKIERAGKGLVLSCGDDTLVVDAVFVGVGMQPAVALAQTAGIAIEQGIVVDAESKTNVDAIWAAGDCAVYHRLHQGRRIVLESWQNAEEQAAAAARSIAGLSPATSDKQPWFWSDQFGENFQILGLPAASDHVFFKGVDERAPAAGDALYFVDAATQVLNAVMTVSAPGVIHQSRSAVGHVLHADRRLDFKFLKQRAGNVEEVSPMNNMLPAPKTGGQNYRWPAEGLARIPDWVYTDKNIYEREVERIFHGKTWNFVALECEIPNAGDYIRSNVGPTPVVVSRANDGSVHVFENRCSHRAAEFCRELNGNAREFVCPYHQWSYDLTGKLAGVPFRRGAGGKGGMPADFNPSDHGPRRLKVATHRGVVFASYADDMESIKQYLGEEVLREFNATFDGRKLKLLGYYRHTLAGNWKLYHENLRDPYHATLLHTFLVTFGLVVAGNKFMMLMDPTGRHGVMGSAKSDAKNIDADNKKEMRAFKENMTLAEPRFMDFIPEFDSPWSVTMATIWPNLIVQREMNTLGIRHIIPTGPNEFIMKWTMFGFEGDDDEMTRHRLRQGNLMGPAGFLGIEDNEAIKFVQDGMLNVQNKEHLVMLDPAVPAGSTDSIISEAAIRAMYKYWRAEMGV